MRYAMFPESNAAHEAYDPFKMPLPDFPRPTITSGDLLEIVTPTPVLKLRELAEEAGWSVMVQYSRGWMPHATTGRPGAEQHLIALKFGAHPMNGRGAYAVYRTPVARTAWTWSSRWIWGPAVPPFGGCSAEQFEQFLRAWADLSDPAIRGWIEALKGAAVEAENLKAQTICRDRVIREWARDGMSVVKIATFEGLSVADVEKIIERGRRKPKSEGN